MRALTHLLVLSLSVAIIGVGVLRGKDHEPAENIYVRMLNGAYLSQGEVPSVISVLHVEDPSRWATASIRATSGVNMTLNGTPLTHEDGTQVESSLPRHLNTGDVLWFCSDRPGEGPYKITLVGSSTGGKVVGSARFIFPSIDTCKVPGAPTR